MTVNQRVAMLVDISHAGVVNAAAHHIGMPQPTLLGIISGRTKEPREAPLRAIADFYGVTPHWLRTGEPDTMPNYQRIADRMCNIVDAEANQRKAKILALFRRNGAK